MHVTCKFGFGGSPRLTSRGPRKLVQAFTRWHVPCAMCHQSTHDRHHRRSAVLARRMVPRRSRSDQPFGRYSRKCLNTHKPGLTDWLTDWQTRPANYFSPTHQRKSSFIERSMLKHLNVHSLRFWINRFIEFVDELFSRSEVSRCRVSQNYPNIRFCANIVTVV